MTLPLGRGHCEALESSDEVLKSLVEGDFSAEALQSFVASYDRSVLDPRALFPVLNSLETEFKLLKKKYCLDNTHCQVFIAPKDDVMKITCYLNFLTFVHQRLPDKSQSALLTWFIEFDPHNFFLAANPEIAIAAMTFANISRDYFSKDRSPASSSNLIQVLEMYGFIPMYQSFAGSESNYALYLDPSTSNPPQSPIQLGEFKASVPEIENHTTLELIELGMGILPRNMWPELVYLCRKAVLSRTFDLEERLELVGLHVLQLIQYERAHTVSLGYQLNYTIAPYADILNTSLLQKFPVLTRHLVSILTRYRDGTSLRKTIHDRLESEEILVFALKTKNAELVEAIVAFYGTNPGDWKTITPVGAFVIIQNFEELSRTNENLPAQIAIIKALKQSIKEKDTSFAPEDEYASTIQLFVSMVRQNLEVGTEKNIEICKGLLLLVWELLTFDSSEVLTLVNDTVTLRLLAMAMSYIDLQISSISCLCAILNADMLCYGVVESSGLLGEFVNVTDKFALARLVTTLSTTDRGKELLSKYSLQERLLDDVFGYAFEKNSFSQEYYLSVADAVTADPKCLTDFGDRVPGYMRKVLIALDNGPDECTFNIKEYIWRQYSQNTNMVDHFLLLLAAVIHRDQVRDRVQHPEDFDILMKILSHKHLPYEYVETLGYKEAYKHILNELFLVKNAENLIKELLTRLRENLGLDLRDTAVLRRVNLYILSLRSLQIEKGNEFTKKIANTLISNEHFQQLTLTLPETICVLLGAQFDIAKDPKYAFIRSFFPTTHTRFQVVETLRVFQLQQLISIRDQGVQHEVYNAAKAMIMPIIHTQFAAQALLNVFFEFITSSIRSRLSFPQKFLPGQHLQGIINVLSSNQLKSTRDRYILAESGFVTRLDRMWDHPYFVLQDGMKVLIDLWVKLHVQPTSQEKVQYEPFISTDYFGIAERHLKDCFGLFICSAHDWNTITAVDPSYTELIYVDKIMQARQHIISQIVEHHPPIPRTLTEIWWQDNSDPIAHLPQRQYILDNLVPFFQNQSEESIRYGIRIVVNVLKTFEHQRPILCGMVRGLFEKRDMQSIALLAGLYGDTGMSYKLPKPSIEQLKSVYEMVFTANQTSGLIMCACQFLSSMKPALLAKMENPAVFISQIETVLKSVREPRTIQSILQLATVACLARSTLCIELVETAKSVSNYCVSVFREANYELDSVIAYSILSDFMRAIIECDPAVLETSMYLLVSEACPNEGTDIQTMNIKLSGYTGRSQECFNAALCRNFMTDESQEVVFPRAAISNTFKIPLVSGNVLSKLSPAAKRFIDTTISGFISKSTEYTRASAVLLESHIESDEFYSTIAFRTDASEEGSKIDYKVVKAWANFRIAYFALKLEADVLAYLTVAYGAAVEYISLHERFGAAIKSGLLVAMALSMQSGSHRQVEGLRNHQRDGMVRFILNLLGSTNALVIKRTVGSFKTLLDTPRPGTNARDIAMGIIYIGPPRKYNGELFKEIEATELLSSCFEKLGLTETPNRNPVYDPEPYFYYYYTALSCGYDVYEEEYLENKKTQGLEKEGETTVAGEGLDGTAITSGGSENDQTDISNDSGVINHVDDTVSERSNEGSSGLTYENGGASRRDVDEDEDATDIMELNSGADEDSDYEVPFFGSDGEDYESEGPVVTGGPFDFGAFMSAAPERLLYNSWNFDVRDCMASNATETLDDSVFFPDEDDDIHMFFCDIDWTYLTMRGVNIAPAHHPDDPKYIPLIRPDTVRPAIGKFNTFGYESHDDDTGLGDYVKILVRNWNTMRSIKPIDWSLVPKWKPSKPESPMGPKKNEGSTTLTSAILKHPEDAANESTNYEVAYHIALSSALYLLERPEELKSWGLDSEALGCLPESARLDSLISYLMLNRGADMTQADIRATLDDSAFYELVSLHDPSQKVPEYIQSSVVAQLPKLQGTSSFLRNAIYSEKPHGLALDSGLTLRLGAMAASMSFSYSNTIPVFSESKKTENEVLVLFRNKLEACDPELYMKPLEPFTAYFSRALAGNLDPEPIIDILDNQQVLRDRVSLSNILSCFQESVKMGDIHEIAEGSIDRLLSVYLSSLLSARKQSILKKAIQTMSSRGFFTNETLKRRLCCQIMGQLDACMEKIGCGNLSGSSFRGLEAVLSALARHPLCDLNEGSEGIIDKAFNLGSQLSDIITNGGDSYSSIRLLRWYLLLVTLTPRARAAFIVFVRENRKFVNRVVIQDRIILKSCMANLKGHYNLLDYGIKTEIIRSHFPQRNDTSNEISVRREALFTDSFTRVSAISASDFLNQAFRVKFETELGFDGGGLTKEWLTLLARELPNLGYGLFNKVSGSGNGFIVHPNPQCLYDEGNLKLYEFIGKMMAKAILLKQTFDCNFSRIIYASIVSKSPGLHSLKDLYLFDNDLAKSLEWILENEISGIIMETFVAKSNAFGNVQLVELKEGGREIAVCEENKEEYVSLMVKHIMFTGVEKQIMAICNGFWSVVPYAMAKILEPFELEKLLCGGELDIEEWKANAVYQVYTPSSMAVKFFWMAIKSMSDSERREVLMFATGTDKVSALGFSGTGGAKFTIGRLQERNRDGLALPTASTCMSMLYIPEYTSHEEALLSLRKAKDFGGLGFGFS